MAKNNKEKALIPVSLSTGNAKGKKIKVTMFDMTTGKPIKSVSKAVPQSVSTSMKLPVIQEIVNEKAKKVEKPSKIVEKQPKTVEKKPKTVKKQVTAEKKPKKAKSVFSPLPKKPKTEAKPRPKKRYILKRVSGPVKRIYKPDLQRQHHESLIFEGKDYKRRTVYTLIDGQDMYLKDGKKYVKYGKDKIGLVHKESNYYEAQTADFIRGGKRFVDMVKSKAREIDGLYVDDEFMQPKDALKEINEGHLIVNKSFRAYRKFN